MISICLPSRNTRPFLEERKASILAQTEQDFEVIVVDDASEDGSRDFFERWADEDRRVSVFEGPGEGLYAGWNDALRRASGDYVYLATSDDTMAPDCLEKLAGALARHPECGLARCHLRALGDAASIAGDLNRWWERHSPYRLSCGARWEREHVRPAPIDGLLHISGMNTTISVTQLLVRRRVFAAHGLFESIWGPAGDTEWNGRIGMLEASVHVPDTWGGWRCHAAQVTQKNPPSASSWRQALTLYRAVRARTREAVSLGAEAEASERALIRYCGARWRLKSLRRPARRGLPPALCDLVRGAPAAPSLLAHRCGFASRWMQDDAVLAVRWLEQIGLLPSSTGPSSG